MKFIDEAIIEIQSGHGGKGAVSFRREKYVPRGGPDGGHGGRGGHVIFEATHNLSTLLDFRYKKQINAPNGENGQGSLCDGRAAEDVIIPVPVGTVVYDAQNDQLIVDFVESGQRQIIAKGGRGGKGNSHFVSSTRQTPRFSQDGEAGELKNIRLELKLLADVGLIGCPNAGKSTFLSVVSKAKPKIADYPFTTLEPGLGVVAYGEHQSFVMADLPGLIVGAHTGKGMGDKFLKHAERTKVVVHLVSLSPEEEISPVERYQNIKKEVTSYYQKNQLSDLVKQRLLFRELVVLSKTDLVDQEYIQNCVEEFAALGIKALNFSAVTKQNLDLVMSALVKELKHEVA